MYGRGSYAPPYGQGQVPQRPMPPYQQQPPGPHFQQGHPLMPGMPPPPPSGYQNRPPPPPMGQQSRPYQHPPQLVHGGHPPQHPYMQHANHAPPPPPPSMYGAPVHQSSAQHGGQHMPLPPHLPPPPPLPSAGLPPPPLPTSSPSKPPPPPSFTSPSSPGKLSSGVATSDVGPASDSVTISETIANGSAQNFEKNGVPISDDYSSQKQNIVMDLPPPPPKPTDEKVLRNIEVLCQFIAKNGPGFEDMARQKESGNPEFIFLFGGEPGSDASCAFEYYLWMKKKCGLTSSMHERPKQMSTSPRHIDSNPSVPPYSTSIVAAYHSPSDSDVDMEDDITQTEREPDVNFAGDIELESVHAGDMLDVHRQDNALHASKDSPSKGIEVLSGADVGAEKSSGQPPKMDSPFTLIQNYVSDDNSEDIGDLRPDQEVVKSRAPSPESGIVSKSQMASEEDSNASASADPVMLPKDVIDSQALQPGVQETLIQASPHVNIDDRVAGAEVVSTNATIPGKFSSEITYTDTVSTCKQSDIEDKNNNSSAAKVDEFGRTVKEDARDSEDEDTHRYRKRGRRDRSRSRSRSPSDRRRRSPRRSPRRRKERRSRSRSWSPKRRRSRSKSPFRPGGDGGDDRSRRDRGPSRDCFDFLKGRCYRGASCRYVHPESNKSSSSRRSKTKQYDFDTSASSRGSDFRGGSFSASVATDNYEVNCDKSLHLDQHDGDDLSSERHDNISQEKLVNDAAGKPSVLDQDAETSVADIQKCQVDTQIQGAPHVANTNISTGEEKRKLVIDLSEAGGSAKACQQLATSSQILPVSGTSQTKISDEPTGLAGSTPDFSQQTPDLASPLEASQKTNTLKAPSGQTNDQLMAPSVTNPPQHAGAASVPQYQAPFSNQQSHYPIPPNPSWGILPPPPARPPYSMDPSIPPGSLQFLQGHPPSRNDFSSQPSFRGQHLDLPTHSQVVGTQHHNVLLHTGNQPNLPSQGIAPPSSFAPGILPTPPIQYPGSAIHSSVRPFPSETPPQSNPSGQSFQNHPFPQLRPSQFGTQQIAPGIQSSHSGGTLPMPGYSSDPLNRDHPSGFSDNAGSRIPAHYNPFASTFDQPLSSRFSSTAFMQQRESAGDNKYDSSLSYHHVTAQGQSSSAHVSGKMVASPNSRAGGETLQKSGGDQYDPLFDSIEPSSESFKKHARKIDHAADYSDVMTRQSTHSKVSDVEEKNRQEPGAVAAVTSFENDEFGETADAEVGAVENGSPSDSDDDAVADGEFEIDQVKPDGKGKKKKDSRSMRLFKVAVANFVKDVLKPQWRQGNMSKEVFKTIVKKTVDKVSGAMKNHRVPKSQAKIDHYIDSSRRKLTQLVEGYVSKYKS